MDKWFIDNRSIDALLQINRTTKQQSDVAMLLGAWDMDSGVAILSQQNGTTNTGCARGRRLAR